MRPSLKAAARPEGNTVPNRKRRKKPLQSIRHSWQRKQPRRKLVRNWPIIARSRSQSLNSLLKRIRLPQKFLRPGELRSQLRTVRPKSVIRRSSPQILNMLLSVRKKPRSKMKKPARGARNSRSRPRPIRRLLRNMKP